MKIVIDIPKEMHEAFVQGSFGAKYNMYDLVGVVMNGTVLPKGHGNLIQREEAEAIFRNAKRALYEQSRKGKIDIKDFQTREMMLLNAEQFVHLIKPVIEADEDGDRE